MKIGILDDHLLFAELLESVLPLSFKNTDIRVFSDPVLFLDQNFNLWNPDVILCDLFMPEIDGLEIVLRISKLIDFSGKIIMVSGVIDPATVQAAMNKGADAYVSKEEPLEELEIAIIETLAGRKYISKTLAKGVLNKN